MKYLTTSDVFSVDSGTSEGILTSTSKDMWSSMPNPLQMESYKYGYTIPNNTTDWESYFKRPSPIIGAKTDQIKYMSGSKNEKEIYELLVKKLFSSKAEEYKSILPETNTEVCFSNKTGGSSVEVDDSTTTETNISDCVLSQPNIQTLPLDSHTQSETESSSQAITNTSSSSPGDSASTTSLSTVAGQQMSPSTTSLSTAAGQRMSDHNDNRSTGARPKLIASRTSRKNSRQNKKHKNVTWSEEKTYVTFVDDVSYDHYRNCILNFCLPNRSRALAAVEAVLFIRGTDEPISLSLIDIALKFLWVKLGSCPKAVPLYTTICDFEYDERPFVLAFLELCRTEPTRSVANALFGNIQILLAGPENANPVSQHSNDETDISQHTFSSTPEQNNTSHSFTDNYTANSEQQSSHIHKEKPLEATFFHIPLTVSNLQENLQPTCEANHSDSHNHHPVPHIHHPVSHFHHVDSTNIQVPCEATNSVSPNYLLNDPVSHIHHANSTTDSANITKQQRLPVSEEQMRHLQIEVLKREQKYLKNALTCVLCKNKPAEVTLLPCGHFVLCAACSDDCDICPVCNKEALAELKTYLC